MRYWPNPAHELETTEAGPPQWSPDKDACPRGMTVQERQALLAESIAVDSDDPRSRRFATRRTSFGIELFDIKYTEDQSGEACFHGHPASRLHRGVLRQWRDAGKLTQPSTSA